MIKEYLLTKDGRFYKMECVLPNDRILEWEKGLRELGYSILNIDDGK